MGISLDGLASGLDTTELLAKLMSVEAAPRTLLVQSKAKANTVVTDLQTLNSRLAALLEQANAAAKPQAIAKTVATSSSASVTVTTGAEATPGGIDLTVARVASAHVMVSAAMPSWPGVPPVLTIVRPDGSRTQIVASGDSTEDVARAVNAAELGIRATRVQAGADAGGAALSRLQFASTETGADASFRVFLGTEADVDAGTAAELTDQPGAALLRQGADAEVVLFAGTPAEQRLTNASNTFTGLLPGVDVTVSAVTASPVSIDVAADPKASTAAASAFLDRIEDLLAFIDQKSATSKTTDASGNAVTALGSFTSDANIRTLRQAIASAVQSPVDGASIAPLGISISKTGQLEFDADRFAAALADDPARVRDAFATVATRIGEVADRYSDRYDGLLTRQIQGRQATIADLDRQIESWTSRLAQREATLKRTYAALEVALSSMNSQSSFLASQLANLPTWTPKTEK
ncbi:flagellar filament capping protein FliD [Agromyces soli]